MASPELERFQLLLGRGLRSKGSTQVQANPSWYDLAERTRSIISDKATGGGNAVGITRGVTNSSDGLAVLDLGGLLESMANRKKNKE